MEAANFKYEHPRGVLYAYITGKGLHDLLLPDPARSTAHIHFLHSAPNVVLGRTLYRALDNYFAGMKEPFARIPLDLGDGTPFQQAVWQAARGVPWGRTCSYGDLARAAGHPKASRAVGAALGANPVPIIVPCHRIIGANGRLTGFSGGHAWKEELLGLEGFDRNAMRW